MALKSKNILILADTLDVTSSTGAQTSMVLIQEIVKQCFQVKITLSILEKSPTIFKNNESSLPREQIKSQNGIMTIKKSLKRLLKGIYFFKYTAW